MSARSPPPCPVGPAACPCVRPPACSSARPSIDSCVEIEHVVETTTWLDGVGGGLVLFQMELGCEWLAEEGYSQYARRKVGIKASVPYVLQTDRLKGR